MDFYKILLALLLFFPAYLMGFVSNSKIFTILLSVTMAGLVMIYEGGKYLYLDIIIIIIALYFAIKNMD